jgi:hypothetical protein
MIFYALGDALGRGVILGIGLTPEDLERLQGGYLARLPIDVFAQNPETVSHFEQGFVAAVEICFGASNFDIEASLQGYIGPGTEYHRLHVTDASPPMEST